MYDNLIYPAYDLKNRTRGIAKLRVEIYSVLINNSFDPDVVKSRVSSF